MSHSSSCSRVMFTLQEVCRRALFEPWVFTWISESRQFCKFRPPLWSGSPPTSLNITGFHTRRLCAFVSVVRAVPGDLCGELIPPCKVCRVLQQAAVLVWAQPCTEWLWWASLSCSVRTDSQHKACNALAQAHCLERKDLCMSLGSEVSNSSFQIILHLRRLSESGLHTPIKKKYWG